MSQKNTYFYFFIKKDLEKRMTIKRYFVDNGTGDYLPKRYRSFFYSREIDVIFFPCSHEDARHGADQGEHPLGGGAE